MIHVAHYADVLGPLAQPTGSMILSPLILILKTTIFFPENTFNAIAKTVSTTCVLN